MRSIQFSFRSRPAAWAVVAIMTFAALASAESGPFQARVMTAGAAVRSGPGDSFYLTNTLAEGQVVDVYRQDSNGWLSIRPPEESFSWVFARNVTLLDDSLAEINKDNVASRIGSRLSNKRNAVQVRLKKGETVQIVGEDSTDGQKWYKIAPPSGEFRWIHVSNVQPLHGLPATVPAQPTAPVAPAILTTPISGGVTTTADAEPVARDNWRAAATPIDQTTSAPPNSLAAPPLATIAPAPSAAPVTTTPSAPGFVPPTAIIPTVTASAPAPTAPTPIAASGVSRQVADLDLRLSRMVAEPPASWNVDALQREAEQLLSQSQTAADRDAVKATLTKIDRFAAIGRRYRQTGADATTPIPGSAVPADAAGYDAVGVLRPVVSKRPGAPQFALVDEKGQVVSFVTPTPDVNLQAYVGRRVGVLGNRGYIPEFRRSHVVAGRVTPLANTVVR